jgi:hypothetical protein
LPPQSKSFAKLNVPGSQDNVMDCAGRAQRRRRFRPHEGGRMKENLTHESGVALRLPPQSKSFARLNTAMTTSQLRHVAPNASVLKTPGNKSCLWRLLS